MYAQVVTIHASCIYAHRWYWAATMTTSISKQNAGMEANLKHIVAHSVRDNPVPLHPTAVTRGFEKTAFPKIVSAG